MLVFALLLQAADSTYSSPALRNLVAAAAAANRIPPPELKGYRAAMETEFSFIIADTLGRERAGEIEQLAANTAWNVATGEYTVHTVGYRIQNVGLPYSALNLVSAWTQPSLYGERFYIGNFTSTERTRTAPGRTRYVIAVHPFATDRDRFYRFTGGDTVSTLRAGERTISIVRIRVVPRALISRDTTLLDGEIDVDAERHHIVRMRGRFLQSGMRGVVTQIGYAEFVNAEIGGRFWLPAFQRAEFQSTFSFLAQSRFVFRIVTRFSDYEMDVAATDAPRTATARGTRLLFSYAPTDSMSRYSAWRDELGVTTSSVHSNDFEDVAPDAWRADGPPRLRFFPRSTPDIFRFNRVEGLFAGLAPTVDFRDMYPGSSAGVFGGVATAERTLRGGAQVSLRRTPWSLGLRAERALVSTNDFTSTLTGDAAIGALLSGEDNYDYVDRLSATVTATRALGSPDAAMLTVSAGPARDRAERAHLSHGIWGGTPYLLNRGAESGGYAHGVVELELHPAVTGLSVEPGVGARLRYEGGTGQLAWQRAELGLVARRNVGALSVGARADGGVVIASRIPPQTLFEVGGESALPGFAYKEFAGDRAAVLRVYSNVRLPFFNAPLRLGGFTAPGIAPALRASVQTAWTELSTDAARRSAIELGSSTDGGPIPGPTRGMRASVFAGLTFLGGIARLGAARQIDRASKWRLELRFGGD